MSFLTLGDKHNLKSTKDGQFMFKVNLPTSDCHPKSHTYG